jgi:hypothetical protein
VNFYLFETLKKCMVGGGSRTNAKLAHSGVQINSLGSLAELCAAALAAVGVAVLQQPGLPAMEKQRCAEI